jgi:hypothetical protein
MLGPDKRSGQPRLKSIVEVFVMTSMVEDHVKVEAALRHLIPRLEGEYGRRRSRSQIEEAVNAAYARFADARVEVFVPVLVERAAHRLLDR